MSVVEPVPQHMQALNAANAIRLARAVHRRHIRSLDRTAAFRYVADLVVDVPDVMESLPVGRLLDWLPRVGSLGVRRILADANGIYGGFPIRENRALGTLTRPQAQVLARVLSDRAEAAAA